MPPASPSGAGSADSIGEPGPGAMAPTSGDEGQLKGPIGQLMLDVGDQLVEATLVAHQKAQIFARHGRRRGKDRRFRRAPSIRASVDPAAGRRGRGRTAGRLSRVVAWSQSVESKARTPAQLAQGAKLDQSLEKAPRCAVRAKRRRAWPGDVRGRDDVVGEQRHDAAPGPFDAQCRGGDDQPGCAALQVRRLIMAGQSLAQKLGVTFWPGRPPSGRAGGEQRQRARPSEPPGENEVRGHRGQHNGLPAADVQDGHAEVRSLDRRRDRIGIFRCERQAVKTVRRRIHPKASAKATRLGLAKRVGRAEKSRQRR